MDIVNEIRKITDPTKLNEILAATKSQLQFAARFAYTPGSLVLADFNTRGVHEAVVTKTGGKTVHIVLLGESSYLPRRSRQWRTSPQMLSPLPDDKKAAAQQKYESLKKESPSLFLD